MRVPKTKVQVHPIICPSIADAKPLVTILLVVFYFLWQVSSCFAENNQSVPTQVSTSISETTGIGDLDTKVHHQTGTNIYQITGGHLSGSNLFHSFETFSIAQGDTARFETSNLTQDLSIKNILGRVTDGNPSYIFGTIDSATFYPGANLLLMNPSGIVLGPTATLNVGGSVAFTTADYLRLAKADGSQAGIFDAHATVNKLLTSAPVAAFGFLDHEQTAIPAPITVRGSALEVSSGKSLSLVGGDITIESSRLGNLSDIPSSASARQILMASVSSSGEVLAGTMNHTPNIKGQTFSDLGTVQILKESLIDASGVGGGRIRITGGRLVVNNSILGSNTGSIVLDAHSINVKNSAQIITFTTTVAKAGDITLSTSGDIAIDSAAGIQSISQDASGSAGNIALRSTQGNIGLTKDAFITSQTRFGNGNSGNIDIDAQHGDIHLEKSSSIFVSAKDGTGTIGGINISANNLNLLEQSRIDGNNFSAQPAGNLLISLTGRLSLTGGAGIETTTTGEAAAPDVIIKAREIVIAEGSSISASTVSSGGGGNIRVQGPSGSNASILINGLKSSISTDTTDTGAGGTIDLSVQSLVIRNGGTLSATTSGPVRAATGGSIIIQATDHVTMTNGASITASTSGPGDAGDVVINAKDVSITSGAKITAESTGTGKAGTVTIQGFNSPANSFFLDGAGSSISTSTSKSGVGGNILIHAKDIRLTNGGKVSADTSGATTAATGGTITMQGDRVRIENGALVTSSTSGAAKGGTITVTARESASISDGAAISASSTGLGDAGNISVHAGQRFMMHDGSVTTSASQSVGGNIEINATDLVSLVNGRISTSVLGGSGNGGNISIDPNMVVLQNNSQIVANALAGHGGNITIATPVFLADQSSLVDASSLFGISGTVTIQSPISNLSGTVGQLTSQPSPVHLFVQNRCVALANGQPSTLIVGGRQTFSTTPGGWASSPTLMAVGTGEPVGGRSEERTIGLPVASENEKLSLRPLTPPSFLVRSFANDVHTGCRL